MTSLQISGEVKFLADHFLAAGKPFLVPSIPSWRTFLAQDVSFPFKHHIGCQVPNNAKLGLCDFKIKQILLGVVYRVFQLDLPQIKCLLDHQQCTFKS